jgi:Ca2+-transporting ATPase
MFYFPLIETEWPSWMPFVGGEHFVFFSPVFNFADASISVSVVLLVLFFLFESTPGEPLSGIHSAVSHSGKGFTLREQSLFFTVFVMLQFWNLFNAKAFLTGRSAFHRLSECREFLFIVLLIFVGQLLIVQFGGRMFSVTPLTLTDWLLIVVCTSSVFLLGELARLVKKACRQ